jgi:hypothetical protein
VRSGWGTAVALLVRSNWEQEEEEEEMLEEAV